MSRSRRCGIADPAVRYCVPGRHLHQRGQPRLQPDRRLYSRQRPAHLAEHGKDLEISAEVTNLFDKYYLLTLFDLTVAGAGVASAQPGRPREWAVTVKKKF